MVTITDEIVSKFSMMTGDAQASLGQLNSKLGKTMRQLEQLQKLQNAGLGMNKSGQLFDSHTGKFVSMADAAIRLKNSVEDISKIPTKADLLKNIGTEVREGVGQVSQLAKQLGMAAGNGADVSAQVKAVNEILKDSPNEMKMFNTQLKNATHHAQNMARIGKMFGFLFGGMQLQRIGLSITRFVLPAMDKVENYTSRGTRQVNAMKASFEFLKFSIFETFTQTPLFQKFVDLVITATNWLSTMVAKHPMLVQIAAVLGGVAVVLGTLAIGAGIFNQFAMMAGYIGKKGSLLAGVGALKTALMGLPIALIALGIAAAYNEFPELKESAAIAFSTISDAIRGVISNFFDLFSATVDTTDLLYLLGSVANLSLSIISGWILLAIEGVNNLIDLVKTLNTLFELAKGGAQALFGIVSGKGPNEGLNKMADAYRELEDNSIRTNSRQNELRTSMDKLSNVFHASYIGITEGRDASLRYNSATKILENTKDELFFTETQLNSINQDLIKDSEILTSKYEFERNQVISLTGAYQNLARAKSSASGVSRGSSSPFRVNSNPNQSTVGSITGG